MVCTTEDDKRKEEGVMHSLEKPFGGYVISHTKYPCSNVGNHKGFRRDGKNDNNQRLLNASWWRAVKGCFVCCKDHTAGPVI